MKQGEVQLKYELVIWLHKNTLLCCQSNFTRNFINLKAQYFFILSKVYFFTMPKVKSRSQNITRSKPVSSGKRISIVPVKAAQTVYGKAHKSNAIILSDTVKKAESQMTGSAGKTPYEVCDNQFGRDEVKKIIGRIDYGVYS